MCDCKGTKKHPARAHIVDGRATWYEPWCGECFGDVGIPLGAVTPEVEAAFHKAWDRPEDGFIHSCAHCGQPIRRRALIWEGAKRDNGLIPVFFTPGYCIRGACIDKSAESHVLIGYRKGA